MDSDFEVVVADVADLAERNADVLQVIGGVIDHALDTTDEDGNVTVFGRDITARGWVSATTHFYPPEDYYTDSDGVLHLVAGATPRAMTTEEKQAYCTDLLIEQFKRQYVYS